MRYTLCGRQRVRCHPQNCPPVPSPASFKTFNFPIFFRGHLLELLRASLRAAVARGRGRVAERAARLGADRPWTARDPGALHTHWTKARLTKLATRWRRGWAGTHTGSANFGGLGTMGRVRSPAHQMGLSASTFLHEVHGGGVCLPATPQPPAPPPSSAGVVPPPPPL